jgi:hypothetical protein
MFHLFTRSGSGRPLPFLLLTFTLTLLSGLFLVACGNTQQPEATAVAEIIPQATDTPTPTETAVPPTETPTPTPTDTPTPTPTDTPTPTPTETPTPTNTPTPTETPLPTDTPTPANTPTPVNTLPPPATPTPEQIDTITLYYRSNPSEILGVFPVYSFNGQQLYGRMTRLRNSLYTMRNSLDGARDGDAEACSAYNNAYNNILYSGVFYDDVPGDWENIDFVYVISFIYSLDRTRPAHLSCANSGQVDSFNYGLAYQAIDQVLDILNPAIQQAAAKPGITP